MLVQRCDRCKLVDVPCVTVLGKDLCLACQEQFSEWVSLGALSSEPTKLERAGLGQRWRQVEVIVQKHGHVTSQLLHDHFGLNKSSGTWYLHSVRRQGKLEYHGKGVFTPVREAAQ